MQKEEVAAWVEKTLKAAGISYAAASRKLGLPPDAISKVVRIERDLSATGMSKIADMGNVPTPRNSVETGMQPRYVTVIGEVAAGLWRDVTSLDFVQYEILAVVDTRWPEGAIFAEEVKGDSINKKAQDGDHVIALHRDYAPRDIVTGDWVIVDRVRHDLRERTIKRAKRNADGDWELWPFSDSQRYQEPLIMGEHDGERIEVVAFVLSFVGAGSRF